MVILGSSGRANFLFFYLFKFRRLASAVGKCFSCGFEKSFFQSLICNFNTFMLIDHKVLGIGVADFRHLGGLNR